MCFKLYEVGINLPRMYYVVRWISKDISVMFSIKLEAMPIRKMGLSVSMMIMLFLGEVELFS